MNNHLSYKHPDDFKAVTANKAKVTESKDSQAEVSLPGAVNGQPSLAEFVARKQLWTIDSSEAQRIHEATELMIVADVQPYLFVVRRWLQESSANSRTTSFGPKQKVLCNENYPRSADTVRARVQS